MSLHIADKFIYAWFYLRQSCKSSDTLRRFMYFIFIAVIEKNPDSHRYVVVNGNKTFTALSGSPAYSFEIQSQNSGSPTVSNFVFSDLSRESSISFDSSSEERDNFEKLTLKGFRTYEICSVSLV